jgi:hypothetical protein
MAREATAITEEGHLVETLNTGPPAFRFDEGLYAALPIGKLWK